MSTWRTAWRKLTREAGLRRLRFHDLRHHAITELAESGASDQTIMAIAGHVSPKMLAHYSHIRLEAKRQAINALSGRVKEQVTAQSTSQNHADEQQVLLMVGGREGIRSPDPLLAKRGIKFAKTCRSRRNPLKSDNLQQNGASCFSPFCSLFFSDLRGFVATFTTFLLR
jgi:integrase-like protein